MPTIRSISPASPVVDQGLVDDPGVHVCSLHTVHDVLARTRAGFLVTLINEHLMLETPPSLLPDNHLKLTLNDIARPIDGLVAPTTRHVDELIGFVRRWDRQGPLVIHCWAGISRSTAAAFITVCALNPHVPETRIARDLREASPWATPNPLLVELADAALGRQRRMIDAIETIGDGERVLSEGRPFRVASRYRLVTDDR